MTQGQIRKQTTRIQMELETSALEQLGSLKDQTFATSYSEVVRNALRLYKFVIEAQINGEELVARTKKGDERILIIL